MSITEALEAVKASHVLSSVNWHFSAEQSQNWKRFLEEAEEAIPVIESYVQTHEGQGGLGL